MSDSVSVPKSYGSNVKNSAKGVLVGAGLILGCIGLLWWNEGNFVKTKESLEDAEAQVQEMGDVNSVNVALDGKVVHGSGTAITQDVLSEPIFNFSHNGIMLRRDVKFYQWTETKTETDDKTTYDYKKEWVSSPVNSGSFYQSANHQNFVAMQGCENEEWRAQNVQFGAFTLNNSQIDMIGNTKAYSLENFVIDPSLAHMARVAGTEVYISAQPNYSQAPQQPQVQQPVQQVTQSNTQIGDMRISWQVISPSEAISIVAQQNGNSFVPYQSDKGRAVNLLENGTVDSKTMFINAHSENEIFTWILRAVGIIVMFIGFKMLLGPIDAIASRIPLLSSVVAFGTGLIAFAATAIISITTIAIAWLFYRPVFAIAMICIVGGLVYFIIKNKKKKAAAAAAAEAPEA